MVPRWLRGIWVISKPKNFYRRLLTNATQPEISPNQDKLVYVQVLEERGSYKTEIHCAKLTKSSESYRKLYEAELGANNDVKEGDTLIIAEPKINPLNNKIIGYLKPIKAVVTVKGIKEDRCLVQPNVIIQEFGVGDIAAYEGTEIFGLIRKESSECEFFPIVTTKVARHNLRSFSIIWGELKAKKVGDRAIMVVEGKINEFDRKRIKVDQKAEVKVNDLLNQVIKGEVIDVGDTPIKRLTSEGFEVKEYEVVIVLKETLTKFKSGLPASAEIITTEKRDVLAVPISSLVLRKHGEKEREGVFIVKQGKAFFQPIEKGILGEIMVEIKSGLKEGQEIIIGPYRALLKLGDGTLIKSEKAHE